MNRHSALFTLLAFMTLLLPAIPASAEEFDLDHTKEVLEKLVEQELATGVASISIALVKGDEIVWTAAYGYANVYTKTPATPETIYVTGSTFKSVTATAILQLVEQGKCKLDNPVNQYLGDVQIDDNEKRPVTIRHILSHTSGLTSGAQTVNLWDRKLPATLEEMTKKLKSIRPVEEQYEYNNFAYGMVGLLVEEISGMSYEDYVVEKILAPLGVKTAHRIEPTAVMVERMALPYVKTPKGTPLPVSRVRYDVYPAGDVYLTAEDMVRFLAAHLNGGEFRGARILNRKSVKEAHTKQFFDYGLGWSMGESEDGHTVIQHGGGVPGFNTFMAGDVDAKVGVYVMSNSGNMRPIAMAALALLRGEAYVSPGERKEIPLDAAKLTRFPGVYELTPRFKITITNEDGHLFAQATGQGKLALFPESETKFFIKVVDAQITFKSDASGKVTSLTLHQNGRDQMAKRVRD